MPHMLSATFRFSVPLTMQADGSLFFGGNIFETAPMLEEMGADAVGINCSTGPDQLENIIQNLAGSLSVPVIAKPNAGMGRRSTIRELLFMI